MMKKRVLSMLMVMIMMVSMLSVSVFAAHEGNCTAAAEWSSDAANHWHACVTEGCEVTDVTLLPDYAAHTFDNTHKCTVCGYQGTHAWVDNVTDAVCDCGATHTHALAWVNTDAENHWQVCTDCPVDAAKKYNETTHTWVKDDTASTATQEVFKCDCGATKSSHVHVWADTASNDASKHWYACTDSTCTETNGAEAHSLVLSGSVRSCSVCGYSEEHTHTWSKTMTWDGTYHWYACTDSACSEVKNKGEHHDNTSDYLCDIGDCDAKLTTKTLTALTITGLDTPAEGAAVDFKVSVAESRYGAPSVKWNRVESLSKNTSTALGEGATFAAEEMYNVTIYVPINSKDEISENINVTLDGVKVPFYNSSAAFDAAIKTYEGNNTVYMAKNLWTYSQRYIIISVMFAELGGTHTHVFTSDWIETPAKHYYKCTGCGETKNSEYHYDKNESGLCDVCGFDMKYFNKNATASNTGSGTATHTHSYSTDWVEDISNHWKQCTGCGAKTQSAAHADLNNTGKCDVCGFVMTAAAGHTHTFATEWTETFAQHYKVCSCGAKNEIAAHVDLNNTGKCDTCGYAMTTLSNNGIVADTGDDNATFLWMAAFALSIMGAGATVFFARKKREE